MQGKVIIGLSGGVDSAVAAHLLLKAGYEVIGMHTVMRDDDAERKESEDAAAVARQLCIPFFSVDMQQEFREGVIKPFCQSYLSGETPNPCIHCNQKVKIAAMYRLKEQLAASYIATGHYAFVENVDGRFTVRNALDAQKDQTYVLSFLSQEQLKCLRMPLGAYTKDEIRSIALELGLVNAAKKDSQEICFIPDDDYARYIVDHAEDAALLGRAQNRGNFVDEAGKVLGRHEGYLHYTIGQRRGLKLATGSRIFVKEIRPESCEVVLAGPEAMFTTHLTATGFHGMLYEKEQFRGDGVECMARIRYGHKGTNCRAYLNEKEELICEFAEPVRAVTPGQAVVLYSGEAEHSYVLAAATITR